MSERRLPEGDVVAITVTAPIRNTIRSKDNEVKCNLKAVIQNIKAAKQAESNAALSLQQQRPDRL